MKKANADAISVFYSHRIFQSRFAIENMNIYLFIMSSWKKGRYDDINKSVLQARIDRLVVNGQLENTNFGGVQCLR